MTEKELKDLEEISNFLGKNVELLKLDEVMVKKLITLWDDDPMKVHSLAYSF